MKKIKFPLIMKNGAEVRDIEQLREDFDMESILQYYSNGKLRRWLENNYYDDILEKVDKLENKGADFGEQLAKALGTEWHNTERIDLGQIIRISALKEQMKAFISEEKLEEIKYIADSQSELERQAKAGCTPIYLFGKEFTIKQWMEQVECIGINQPEINLEIRSKEEYQKKKIRLREVSFKEEEMKNIVQISSIIEVYNGLLDVLEQHVENMKKAYQGK